MKKVIKLYEGLTKEITLFYCYYQRNNLDEIVLAESLREKINLNPQDRKEDAELSLLLLFIALVDQNSAVEDANTIFSNLPLNELLLSSFVYQLLRRLKTTSQLNRKLKSLSLSFMTEREDYYRQGIINAMEAVFRHKADGSSSFMSYIFTPIKRSELDYSSFTGSNSVHQPSSSKNKRKSPSRLKAKMRSPTSDSIGEVRRRSSIGTSFKRLSWDNVDVPSIQQALRPISEQLQQFSPEIDLSENIIDLPKSIEPTSPSSTIREESLKVALEEKTPTPIKRITRRLSKLLAKDKLELSPTIEEKSHTAIIDTSNKIQEKKIREITQESPLSGSKSFFDHIFHQNKAEETVLTKSIQEHYQGIYEEYFHRMKQTSKKKTQKVDSQTNTNTEIPLLHVDFTKLVDDTISKSKPNKHRGRTGKQQDSMEETSLTRIERLLECFFQSLHYHDITSKTEMIHQQLMTYLLPGDKFHDELKFIISMIKRIIYSTRRILSYVLPTPSHQYSRAIWDNILLIKRFRPTSVLEVDQMILQEYYRQFKSFAYAIAESPDDDLSSMNKKKLMKNRLMLSVDDASLKKTPILQEIYYAIASLVKDSHEIESFAFLFSPKYGYEQQPHIDYNYDIANPLNLSQKRESQDSDEKAFIPFFHPQMSFSFIYALEDETTLHFINPLDEARMSLHADAGDLLIWSGQQIHYGAKYSQSSNLRLFGNIRSKHCPKAENEFYWYDEENKCIESLQPPSLIPMTQL